MADLLPALDAALKAAKTKTERRRIEKKIREIKGIPEKTKRKSRNTGRRSCPFTLRRHRVDWAWDTLYNSASSHGTRNEARKILGLPLKEKRGEVLRLSRSALIPVSLSPVMGNPLNKEIHHFMRARDFAVADDIDKVTVFEANEIGPSYIVGTEILVRFRFVSPDYRNVKETQGE